MNFPRIGSPIVPREHGAWAVLYGSFLSGLGVAGQVTLPVGFLLVGITAAAFANGSFTIFAHSAPGLIHEGRRRHALIWFLLYAAGAAAALLPLLLVFRMTFLVSFGMGAAFFFVLRMFLIRGREDRTLFGQLAGTAGLTMIGAVTHGVALEEVQPVGAVLWVILFLFFASGVFYVRMRIRGTIAQRKDVPGISNPEFWPCVMYHALLLIVIPAFVVARIVPWAVLLAFAPAWWRAAAGLARGEARLDIRRLGWSEVAVATAFVVILIAAFHLTPPAG
jgi:hypothetical protein